MPPSIHGSGKQARLHIRVDPPNKRLLERAAAHEHKSLSEFVLTEALQSAERVIRERERIVLSESDWNVFMDALETPPAPAAALRRAFRAHAKQVKHA